MIRAYIAAFSVLLVALCTTAAFAGDDELLLRVQDAVGAPGGKAVIILRTYATRPVGQGTICLAMRGNNTASPPLVTFNQARVYGQSPDVVSDFSISQVQGAMIVDLAFSSDSASINTIDGVMAALFFDVSPNAVPGEIASVEIDLSQSTLSDENGVSIPLQMRGGELQIRDPSAPREIAAEVHLPEAAGEPVTLSLQTNEPFSIASGQIAFRYSNRILPTWPVLRLDPRHGMADIKMGGYPGLIVVNLIATSADFNELPGNIVSMDALPNPAYGTNVPGLVQLDPALTHLYDSNGNWISVTLEDAVYATWPERPGKDAGK